MDISRMIILLVNTWSVSTAVLKFHRSTGNIPLMSGWDLSPYPDYFAVAGVISFTSHPM